MMLNLGCGVSPQRDIMLRAPDVLNADIEKSSYCDLVCDAHYLPFKDKVFRSTLLIHVLEHVNFPLKVLSEIKRVTDKNILIKVPNLHNIGIAWNEDREHIYTWGKRSFINILERAFPNSEVDLSSSWRFNPNTRAFQKTISLLLSFFQHTELRAMIKLKRKIPRDE